MADESNGGPAGPGEVEIDLNDPVVATRFAHLAAVSERYLEMFAPDAYSKLTQESFNALLLGLLREEMMVDTQVRPLFSPESAKENEALILQLVIPGQPAIQFQAKRRLELCKNAQEVLAQALLVAFTDAPGLRAVLRVFGWSYMWLAPKPKSPIILARG
jgi:hypothetical protein